METIHNVNLHALKSVNSWDTKRIKAYKDRIQKHISYMEYKSCDEHGNSLSKDEIAIQRFKNYKEELKKILQSREHID